MRAFTVLSIALAGVVLALFIGWWGGDMYRMGRASCHAIAKATGSAP